MKIYEIDEEIRELLNNAMDDDGVIDEDKMLEVQGLSIERDKKILNFAKFLKEKETEIDALKDAEKRIAGRRKSLEGFCSRNKSFLVSLIDKPLSDSEIKVSKRRSDRLIVDEDTFWELNDESSDYVNVKKTLTINKLLLKSHLIGAEFNGAHIEEHYSLQIK